MKIKKFIICSLFFTTVLFILFSCTYDYFEDETNYIVHVPGVASKSISDCRILIYNNESGKLIEDRSAKYPFNVNPRIEEGDFNFKLAPGNYSVFCYTNMEEAGYGKVEFAELESLNTARFYMNPIEGDSLSYPGPPEILYDTIALNIGFPAALRVDTIETTPYIGKILVRFKNFPFDPDTFEQIDVNVTGLGTQQFLSDYTLPTYIDINDNIQQLAEPPTYGATTHEFEHNYFPSLEDEVIKLTIRFLDENNLSIYGNLDIYAIRNGEILQLLSGEKIIIELDNLSIVNIGLVGWDENIIDDGGGTELW